MLNKPKKLQTSQIQLRNIRKIQIINDARSKANTVDSGKEKKVTHMCAYERLYR